MISVFNNLNCSTNTLTIPPSYCGEWKQPSITHYLCYIVLCFILFLLSYIFHCFASVVTGLYICEDNDQVPERFRGLGIRIEDDVVIRDKGGPLILSSDVPKTIADVEQACSQT